ncbi:hypothetical protein [Brevundimonas sp. GCM10030266]|uniref:hypothetical protein n=1 Tax=Brevundimonas sp. GCM10030266 TaxID=3273386 RepID=UPI0036164519
MVSHPLLPATEAAADAYLGFARIADGSAADAAHKDKLRQAYLALKAQDPGGLLNEAEELERWAEKNDAQAAAFPVASAQYARTAAAFREQASGLRAKAEALSNPEMKEAA